MEQTPRRALVGAIQKFSTEDGPGIRTTVFLKGCPLRCAWCHNPELMECRQQIIQMPNSCISCGYCLSHCPQNAIALNEQGKIEIRHERCDGCMECATFCYARGIRAVAQEMTAAEVMAEVIKDKGFYDETGGGMTVSGGEVLAHPEFVSQLIDLAEQEGIRVCLDTSGFGDGDTLLDLARRDTVTHILYDMKAIDDQVHVHYTGRSNALILENLRRLAADETVREKIQMRMPLVRDVNDTPGIIEATADFYRRNSLKRVTLLPYHDFGVVKMRNIGGTQARFQPPTEQRIAEIQACFEERADMETEVLGRVRRT